MLSTNKVCLRRLRLPGSWVFPLITFLFSLFTLHVQSQNLDSLIAIVADRSFDNLHRFDALQQLYLNTQSREDQEFVLNITDKMRVQAIEENNQVFLGDVLLLEGRVIRDKQQTLQKYLECYEIYVLLKDTISMVYALNMIALTHDAKEEMRIRLRYLLKAIEVGGDDPSNSALSAAHANLGKEYQENGRYQKALHYYLESVGLMHLIEDEGGKDVLVNLGTVYFHMAEIHIELEEFEEANSCIDRAEDYYFKGQDLEGPVWANTLRGELYRAKENYDRALNFYGIAARYHIELNWINNDYYQVLLKQAIVHMEIGNYEKSIILCNQIKTRSPTILRDRNECLYLCYKALGNNQKALAHIEELKKFDEEHNKEVLKESQKQMTLHMEMLTDSVKHAEEVRLANEVHEEEVRKQKQTRNWSLSAGFAALVLAGGFYSRWRYVRRSKAIIESERDRSENLLLNILPEEIAHELKETGKASARDFDQVSILFTDFADFTETAEKLTASELVEEINHCFEAFDHILEKYGIEKIKTIGDAYMAAGGLPVPGADSVKNTVLAALEMQEFIEARSQKLMTKGQPHFQMRVGIHTGPVVAGIVGVKKFQYDIWGDTVNTASRIENAGEVGKVNISQATYDLLTDPEPVEGSDEGSESRALSEVEGQLSTTSPFEFESRGKIEVKGKGSIEMWFVENFQS